MFADSPIIVKLHQKIVVSYISVEAIATGQYECMTKVALIATISKGKKYCHHHCSRNWRVCWKNSMMTLVLMKETTYEESCEDQTNRAAGTPKLDNSMPPDFKNVGQVFLEATVHLVPGCFA